MKTIKSLRVIKFILPIVALVSATIFAFAFRSKTSATFPEKITTVNDKVYQFDGDATDLSQVTDLSKWKFISAANPCSDINEAKACTIVVDGAHATNSTLAGSNITITAANDVNSSYYRVTAAQDGAYNGSPYNQAP